MALQCVLWDLDGTVLDSAPGLIFSIRKVLEHFELPPQPEEMLRLACGPLLSYSIEELFGNKGRFVPEMEVYMDEVYAGEGMGLERIFPGIPSCTGLVHRYGRPNCIVTVKPDHLKKHSVRYHPMLQYMFDSWIGTDEMNGIARKEDCVTFHPYTHKGDPRPDRNPFFFADEGRRMKAAQAANGGSSRLRITEYGWTTFKADDDGKHDYWFVGDYPAVTYHAQARYLIRAYALAHSFGVESMMQYDFQDDGPRRDYTEHNFGMTFQNLTPKPSFAAVAFMTLTLGNAATLGDFGSDPKTHRILGFERADGRRVYVAWAVEKPVEIAIPEYFDGKAFTVRNLYGTPVKAAPKDGLKLTEEPAYIIEETDGTNKPSSPRCSQTKGRLSSYSPAKDTYVLTCGEKRATVTAIWSVAPTKIEIDWFAPRENLAMLDWQGRRLDVPSGEKLCLDACEMPVYFIEK